MAATTVGRVAIIGAGAIGTAMACVFADRGAIAMVAEPDAGRRMALRDDVIRRHGPMALAGRARDTAEATADRVVEAETAGEAAAGADLVIEAGPERLDVKRSIFREVLDTTAADTPVVTMSSAITASAILADPADRRRALVAHPANPPTVVPILELVPTPDTDAAIVTQAAALFRWAGFSPTVLGAEIPGFVFNRLQGALLREAYRLVAEGIVDVAGLDRLVRDGLGPRWALVGPFENAELNTAGGIVAHAARMGPAYRAMGEERGETNCDWSDELVADVSRQRRAILPASAIPARTAWREEALARLFAARAPLLDEGPDD